MPDQRRMPMSYLELEEYKKTKELPLLHEPIKHGGRPLCSTCQHWCQSSEYQGTCALSLTLRSLCG